jgi:LPXTG-motif cell wall-anchored protein
MDRRRVAALITAATLALPSAAFAQSAGDEQYDDPFAGEDQEQAEPTPDPDTPTSSDSAQEPTTTTPTPTTTATTAQAQPGQEQLPRTGADAGLLALGGFVLLTGGVALRVKVRR